MVFLACVHLALFLALSLSPGNSLVSSLCDVTIVCYKLLQATLALSLVVYLHWNRYAATFPYFLQWCPDYLPLFNLVRNSVVHSPSSVIRDPRYGNISACSSCSMWMSMRHAMPSLAITLILSASISILYLRLTRSIAIHQLLYSSAFQVANRMMSSA